MSTLMEILKIQENISVIDRFLRAIVGSIIAEGVLIIPLVLAITEISSPLIVGLPYAMIVSFYLLLTGMTGWDPVYALFHRKTCGLSDRNRCGTFTYQLKAALGRHPDHDKGYETHALKPYEHVTGVSYAGCWV